MTDRELLELLLEKVSNLEGNQQTMQSSMQTMQSDIRALQSDMQDVKTNMATKDELAEVKVYLENRIDKLEVRIETEVIDKVRVLFDGHQLHTEQLQRIEEKVSTHDEIIFKRIK